MQKIKIYRGVCVLLFLVSISLSVCLYFSHVSNQKMQDELAQENVENWNTLLAMTQKLEDNMDSSDQLQKFSLYQNGILYAVSDRIQPALEGDNFRFLCTSYDPLMQELASNSGNAEEALVSEGLVLYQNMNSDLQDICLFVISSTEEDFQNKYALLQSDSHFSQEVKALLEEYCEKYREQLESFFEKWQQQSE